MHHRALIKEITLNHEGVEFSKDGRAQIPLWSKPDLNVTKNSLLAVVTFHDHLAPNIRRSSVGFLTLRHHNASTTDANAATVKLHNDSSHLWLALDFNQLKKAISPPLVPGSYAITLQLDNPYLQVLYFHKYIQEPRLQHA